MNTDILNQKGIVYILVSILMVTFGIQSIGYAQEGTPTITASVEAPLKETNLNEGIVTLTLSGGLFSSEYYVRRALTISGVEGVTIDSWDVDRVNDTKVTVELTFSGNIDADTPLVFTVGAGAIADYDGDALTTQVPVTAVAETLVATTEAPLTEQTLSGSVVTITLSGRSYDSSRYDIERALTISGIEGVTVSRTIRISDTQVTLALTFSGNIDTDSPLTITVGASAINSYNQALTAQLPVTAVAESLVATTTSPLTEATLTLSGRSFIGSEYDIRRALTVSGVEGVSIVSGSYIDRVSATKVTVPLIFSGNIDTDATLTLTLGANAIVGYNQAFTVQVPVTAVAESLVATTEAPLTEATLSGSVVTLTLSGRVFDSSSYDIARASSISGIEGVTGSVQRVSNTEATITLGFSGNIDADATITITVGANAIVGYNESFTVQVPVTAVAESLVTTTEAPLTEATLSGSVVTLTLSGRSYISSSYSIERVVTISGIDGVTISDVDRNSDTEITVDLSFSGNIDADATITITVGANAIVGYNESFTVQVPVTAVAESLVATTEAPLTEATLNGSVVTLTLSGRSFTRWESDIREARTISGIEGVTVYRTSRVSDTEVTLILGFSGNMDTDGTLTLDVGAGAIVGYNQGFTLQLPVTSVEESLVASTESPLTEATLHGAVVTLTLTGRTFVGSTFDFDDALTVSGIDGVSYHWFDLDRINDTQWTLGLQFSGNFDVDGNVIITIGADAIVGYNEALTVQVPVTAVEESLVATTETPLTEATLNGSVVTLTLSGRIFTRWESDIREAKTISGIEGVTVSRTIRVSDTEVAILLGFSGNIDTDGTLTLEVGAGAIANYNQGFTLQLPVTAVEESLVATTEDPLTEVTLSGSVVTLTLSGRNFISRESDIRDALSLTGIEGVSVSRYGVARVSNTEVTVGLISTEDFDIDSVLTLTVGADAIAGYNEGFSFEFPVTAVEESMTATVEEPLSEATLTGSVVTLTLSGRHFTDEWSIERALTFSGIEGVFVTRDGVDRVSNTEAKVTLLFSGNIDIDGTFTLTVGADAITSYNQGFSFEFPVTAVEESLVVSTQTPLTEATLYGNSVILTLNGRNYTWWTKDVQDAVAVSGIEGVTVGSEGFYTDGDSQVAVPLSFSGDIDADATLTLTVEAGAIAGYDEVYTTTFSVPAVEESLVISSKFNLNEATLNRAEVILTLNGRSFVSSSYRIRDEISVTGIEGVASDDFFDVNRVNDNAVAVELSFDGTDFDIDSTLTFTVGADAIAGYGEALTAQIPVTAIRQSGATISISPNPIVSPPLSEQLTFSLNILGGKDVAGFQAIVWYDNDTLRYVESEKGNYLPADAYFVAPTVQEYDFYQYPYVPIAATALDGVRNGNGTLATLTFEVYNDVKESEITLTHVYIVDREGIRWEVEIEGTEVTEPPHDIAGDINRDGIVNIRDLVLAGNRFGLSGENRADMNGDGIVDIADLVLVANAFGANAAAPSLNPQILEQLTAADVKEWLTQAQKITLTDPDYKRGITVLEQLHKALIPKTTALLPNFPNPFNPETWIPYHLAKDADVTLHIYAMNGTLVRTLTLGHQAAGMYQSRSRAAYWDGKNEFGEKVATGVYFYTLTAGDFTATRRMLIMK